MSPEQQASHINSLSGYDAAQMLARLDQNQLKQVMAQPGLKTDLLSKVSPFITPASFAGLTQSMNAEQISAALSAAPLNAETYAKILENCPQAATGMKTLIKSDPNKALSAITGMSVNKQGEVFSQLDSKDIAALFNARTSDGSDPRDNSDLFARLSPDQQNSVLKELSAVNPALAQKYLYATTQSLTRGTSEDAKAKLSGDSASSVDHPGLLVNDMNPDQLKALLGVCQPGTLGAILADSKLNTATRKRILDIMKTSFEKAGNIEQTVLSANANKVPQDPQQYLFDLAWTTYSTLDPEGAKEDLNSIQSAVTGYNQRRQESVLKQIAGMDTSRAGELLAQTDISVAQTAQLIMSASGEQKAKLLSALEQSDPEKAKETKTMISRIEENNRKAAQIEKNNEQVRSTLKKVGPSPVADYFIRKGSSEQTIGELALMDQKFIDQTLSLIEKKSPKTAAQVRKDLAAYRQKASASTTVDQHLDNLVKGSAQDAALFIAAQTPANAKNILSELAKRNASFAEATLAQLKKVDYQLADETQKKDTRRLTKNELGQPIIIDGENVYQVEELSDGTILTHRSTGTVNNTNLGKINDSPQNTELAAGVKPVDIDLQKPRIYLTGQTATDNSVTITPGSGSSTPKDAWYDPVNKRYGDSTSIGSTPKPEWNIKREITYDGIGKLTFKGQLDPQTGAPLDGTEMTDEKGHIFTAVTKTSPTSDKQVAIPVQTTYHAGDNLTLTDGTELTFKRDTRVNPGIGELPAGTELTDKKGRLFAVAPVTNPATGNQVFTYQQISYNAGDTVELKDGTTLTFKQDTIADPNTLKFKTNAILTDKDGNYWEAFGTVTSLQFKQINPATVEKDWKVFDPATGRLAGK